MSGATATQRVKQCVLILSSLPAKMRQSHPFTLRLHWVNEYILVPTCLLIGSKEIICIVSFDGHVFKIWYNMPHTHLYYTLYTTSLYTTPLYTTSPLYQTPSIPSPLYHTPIPHPSNHTHLSIPHPIYHSPYTMPSIPHPLYHRPPPPLWTEWMTHVFVCGWDMSI